MRYCANPDCRRPISSCNGFVKAGDMFEAMESTRSWNEVRELCGLCAVKLMALEENKAGTEKFLIHIGYLKPAA